MSSIDCWRFQATIACYALKHVPNIEANFHLVYEVENYTLLQRRSEILRLYVAMVVKKMHDAMYSNLGHMYKYLNLK